MAVTLVPRVLLNLVASHKLPIPRPKLAATTASIQTGRPVSPRSTLPSFLSAGLLAANLKRSARGEEHKQSQAEKGGGTADSPAGSPGDDNEERPRHDMLLVMGEELGSQARATTSASAASNLQRFDEMSDEMMREFENVFMEGLLCYAWEPNIFKLITALKA